MLVIHAARVMHSVIVIPANAGIHVNAANWMPAFGGMTSGLGWNDERHPWA
jgi:hypothetical protein